MQQNKARDKRFDNFKGVLIALVVLGHFLWGYRDVDAIGQAVALIYLFHMPAFIFISGYFSKAEINARSLCRLAVSYVLVNGLMMLFCHFALGQGFRLLTPYYSCWYLLALIFWRLLLPLALKISRNPFVVLLVTGVLAVAVGFTDQVTNEFALSRTVAFFPFFMLGYYCRNSQSFVRFMRPFGSPSPIRIAVGLASFVLCLAVGWFVIDAASITLSDELMVTFKGDLSDDALRRMAIMLLATACSFSLLACMPSRELPLITKWGRNTLTIYLFHRVFPLILLVALPVIQLSAGTAGMLLAFSVATTAILGADFVSSAYGKLVARISHAICDEDMPRARGLILGGAAVAFALLMVASRIL